MRYYYDKPLYFNSRYGQVYECNHLIYSRCTLYLIGDRGLAVIQQRFNPKTKITWWDCIDGYLTDELYLHERFKEYFDQHAKPEVNDIYPTVSIRQIMHALRMKPLPKERWETVFDRKDI